MRLGKLLTQLIAIGIGLALVAGSYFLYRQHEVRAFNDKLHALQAETVGEMLDFLKGAPSATCRDQASSFESAVRTVLFIDKGRMRLISRQLANPEADLNEVIDETGLYVWHENENEVLYVDMETLRTMPTGGLSIVAPEMGSVISTSGCDIWWSQKDAAFEVPARLRIIPFSSFQPF
jgi:hypothetical protein